MAKAARNSQRRRPLPPHRAETRLPANGVTGHTPREPARLHVLVDAGAELGDREIVSPAGQALDVRKTAEKCTPPSCWPADR